MRKILTGTNYPFYIPYFFSATSIHYHTKVWFNFLKITIQYPYIYIGGVFCMVGRRKWISSALVLSTVAGLTFSTLNLDVQTPAAEASSLKIKPLESVSIVQLEVPNKAAMDKLIELNIDLAHRVHYHDGALEVDAVVTPSEIAMLKLYGISVKETLITESQWNQRVAERNSSLQQVKQLNTAEDTVTILRANHFTNQSDTFLYVEAKSTAGSSAATILTAKWLENGVEKSATLQQISDAGEYLYHSFMLPISAEPKEVTIESSLGGKSTSKVTEWLGEGKPDRPKKHYVKNFVDHYMDPAEINSRIENLVKEYPELAEIVELPNKTNGYRRQAQATIGTVQNAAVAVTSKAWGHEGGNAISVELKKAETADAPLSVETNGSKVTVTQKARREK
jgi:hypothetical protein